MQACAEPESPAITDDETRAEAVRRSNASLRDATRLLAEGLHFGLLHGDKIVMDSRELTASGVNLTFAMYGAIKDGTITFRLTAVRKEN